MAFAEIFIGDSVTMCTEAALLGTPVVEYDNYWHEMEQLLELQYKYNLINLFQPPNFELLINKIKEILNTTDYRTELNKRRDLFLAEKIDVNKFLIWFFENYPKSYFEYKKNPYIQYNFK
jgi:predicted glycosyltransferase